VSQDDISLVGHPQQREMRIRMDQSQWIGVRSPEFRAISERIKVASRLSSKLSPFCWDEPEPIREVFEELIGKPVGLPSMPTTG
jgi:hypothetical protein